MDTHTPSRPSATALATPDALAAPPDTALVDDLAALADHSLPESRTLVGFELTGVDAYERAHGARAADELLERLWGALARTVGRSGRAYRLGRTTFAVLARVGRVGRRPLVRAATACLTERRDGVLVAPRVVTPPVAPALDEPAAAVAKLERELHAPRRVLPYLRVSTRFRISVACGLLWMALSALLASAWVGELADSVTLAGAIAIVTGIALIPGYLNAQLIASLLLDRQSPVRTDVDYPGLTLLVAAYDEEADIGQTLAYALEQDYPGPLQVIVADDGSTDDTGRIARGFAEVDDRMKVLEVPHGGKAKALDAALAAADTPLVATIDADTLLMPGALRRVVARLVQSPAEVVAVAGTVMARNPRTGVVGAVQEWDYFLGIGSIKRQQALLQATLVAQGAFSVYDADALRAAGGWPDCIGEDIVMTWALLEAGGRTSYEPTAIAFTEVPATLRTLARQRRRWARGMIEGLRTYGSALVRRRVPYAHSVAANALFPYLDLAYTFAFIPGIVLAIFGNFAIVGPMTLAVLPLNVTLATIMYRRQRASFTQAGMSVRRNRVGLIVYVLAYQLVMAPVSVAGYAQELLRTGRRW